jgi:GNAT superfamily N-acetyltransferase
MSDLPHVSSIASVSATIGSRAANHMDLAFRAIASGSGVESTDLYLRYITGEPHPLGNLAILDGNLDGDGAKRAAMPLLEGEFPSALLFPRGVGKGVEAVASAMGYQSAGLMPAMAVDIEALPATSLPAGCEFQRVDRSEDAAWTEALAMGYGLPPQTARLFSPGAINADLTPGAAVQFFAVKRKDKIVATSVLFLGDGLAGVYCVATLSEERRKGLGAHATAEALRAAQQLGYRVGVLQSSPEGHKVYLKLGFQDFGGIPMFVRMPG